MKPLGSQTKLQQLHQQTTLIFFLTLMAHPQMLQLQQAHLQPTRLHHQMILTSSVSWQVRTSKIT
jgi:hypothetical protein